MLGLLIAIVAVASLSWLQRLVYGRLTVKQRRLFLVIYLLTSTAIVIALYQARISLSRTDIVGLVVGAAVTYSLARLIPEHHVRNRGQVPP